MRAIGFGEMVDAITKGICPFAVKKLQLMNFEMIYLKENLKSVACASLVKIKYLIQRGVLIMSRKECPV